MDPNAALARLREANASFNSAPVESKEEYSAANEMSAAFEDLDEWLSKGGFFPEEWLVSRHLTAATPEA